ncbi:MAG TPA: hemerythrin domain-containing protein [Phycisphaerae bacterium]|nr:hemerythrin domain-containing protein [Phycisphaerae bacterium]
MPVSLGARGQASFEQPLELLQDCHRRIEHFLGVLLRVVEESVDGVLDVPHREALQAALKYFREAAPRHTMDEEESLFPRLRACGGEEVHAALARVEALEADHVLADGLHREVDALAERWLREGRLPAEGRAEMRERLAALRELYRGHLEVEDREIFPLAGKALTAEELASVGREMKARRG